MSAIPPAALGNPREGQRLKTWQLSSSLHCSIIGTCLTARELRQVLTKAGLSKAGTASDHDLHGYGVQLAGQNDGAGKLLNKALDNRHEGSIRRALKASNTHDLRGFWREAIDRGEISGAYWAILSHPVTDADLMREVFGEVHMLSHLVGSASRLDIARLNQLQTTLDAANEKIARQERKLAEAASERAKLRNEIELLKQRLAEAGTQRSTSDPSGIDAIPTKREDGRARTRALTEKLNAVKEEARLALQRAATAEARSNELQLENDAIEARLSRDDIEGVPGDAGDAKVVLYVGGRRRSYEKLRSIAANVGATVLFHDGGLEDNTTLLPAYVSKADIVVFPVDHISHAAMSITKKLCSDNGKHFIPMRSAGLASLIAAIAPNARKETPEGNRAATQNA